ncbi:MAG: FAD:protein FMN transferase [Cytophagales bacterium]|nr:MAG: FAD:protein FMN transferase [Cytophagales bacterium]
MTPQYRNIIYSIILLILVAIVYLYRETQKKIQIEVTGETMGTTYNIKYLDNHARNFKKEIEFLLKDFNQSLSTYIPNSEISQFNKGKKIDFKRPYFYPVLLKSKEIYELSEGAFDPTVAPLVNVWGFGFTAKEKFPDSARIDTLKKVIGFHQIEFTKTTLSKKQQGVMLDFNAIAQGYGVDVIANFLIEKGIQDFMVEIGGEILCKGLNKEGKVWTIGISNPKYEQEGGNPIQATVELNNRALATSGNYRKFYEMGGKKYAHTIDPKTGYPVQHSLLSVSVFAPDAMTADAIATTLMVLGLEKAKKLLEKIPQIDAFFVYTDEKGQIQTHSTENIKKFIQQ